MKRKERASLQRYAIQQMLQGLLEPDEQLIWWDCPALMRIKEPFTMLDATTLLFWNCVGYVLFLWTIGHFSRVNWYIDVRVYWGYLVAMILLRYLERSTKDLLRASSKVRWRKYTYYVITNARALIVVCPKSARPIVLSYTPQEITELKSKVNPDGSGTLFFGEIHKARVGRYGPWLMSADGFHGIRDVQQAEGLLKCLKDSYSSGECNNQAIHDI